MTGKIRHRESERFSLWSHPWAMSLWAVLMGLMVSLAYPAQAGSRPGQGQHSVIQEVDGFAQLSETMTIAEIRQMAFANAKRQALESTQTHIQSNTVMKNGQIEYDIVTLGGEGAVRILEQKDLGIKDNSRYHVWIKAEVAYTLKPKAPALGSNALMVADAPLTVKVWTEKKQYRRGDHIVIFMQGNRDFYARIVDYTSTGEAIQLLPNAYRPNVSFRAGEIYRIPGGADEFALEVRPPYGTEQIVVYASEAPLGQVEMQPLQGGLHRYQGSRQVVDEATRALQVVPHVKAAEFYEATWTFSTRP